MALGSVRNWGCRLETDVVLRGWRAAVLENELLRVTVLLDKGSNIYEFLYKPRDMDFMWRTPQGLRRPPTVPTTRADGAFLEYYEGAWQEIMPSGGPPCSWGGSQFGQHDETPQLNWDATVVEDRPDTVAIRCSVQTVRSPFLLEKTLRLVSGKPVLFIDERLTNYGAETWPYMWGHHPALGEPFLDETCRLDCAAQTVIVHEPPLTPTPRLPAGRRFAWPHVEDTAGRAVDLSAFPPKSLGHTDLAYLTDLTDGWYAVTNTSKRVGFGMAWDPAVFRHIWYWQAFGGNSGHPWFADTYNVGIEPWTTIPGSGLATAVEQGAAYELEPGQSQTVRLLAVAYEGLERVGGISLATGDVA